MNKKPCLSDAQWAEFQEDIKLNHLIIDAINNCMKRWSNANGSDVLTVPIQVSLEMGLAMVNLYGHLPNGVILNNSLKGFSCMIGPISNAKTSTI